MSTSNSSKSGGGYRYQAITSAVHQNVNDDLDFEEEDSDDEAELISSSQMISPLSNSPRLTAAEMILSSARFTAEKCITVWLNVLLTLFTGYMMVCELQHVNPDATSKTTSRSDLHRLAAFIVYVVLLLLQSVFLVGLLRLYLPLVKLNYLVNILGIITSKVFLITYGLSAIETEPKSFVLLIYGLEFCQTIALHFLITDLTAVEEAREEEHERLINFI